MTASRAPRRVGYLSLAGLIARPVDAPHLYAAGPPMPTYRPACRSSDVATSLLYGRRAPGTCRGRFALLRDAGIAGVGPITAGKLIAFNPARFKSEAAFARANGTAPQPASSGKTVRHRLSRGGDRQINTAIYTIALSRSVHHAPSRTYIQRRIEEGKTKREAMRSLKRYLSRDLYNKLSNTLLTT